MSDRKASSIRIAAAVTLALIGGYLGAYYSTVVWWWEGVEINGRREPYYVLTSTNPDPHESSSFLGRFFVPAHWLDRRIRPDVWEPKP